MRALIVDDEPVARKVLREELEAAGSIEAIGEAENGEVALQKIFSLQPDVVFLDIEMPVMGGFELLEHLSGGSHIPAVVMVTAYDQHAIRAFEAGAIDYLLKPISQQRLAQALLRAERIARNPAKAEESLAHLRQTVPKNDPAASNRPRRVVGKLNGEFFLLDLGDVYAFQADGEVTWILTAKGRYIATQNLKAIQERLQDSSFRRIHRNALVNVEHIRKMSLLSSQRWLITLTNGQDFIVSKRQARSVRDVLEW